MNNISRTWHDRIWVTVTTSGRDAIIVCDDHYRDVLTYSLSVILVIG